MTYEVDKGILRLDSLTGGEYAHEEHLPFRPRALILWWARETDPMTALGNRGGMGVVAEGSGQAAHAWAADDELAPGVLRRSSSDAGAFLCCGESGSSPAVGRIRLVEGGFSLDITGRAEGVWAVHYLALGGTDLRAAAVRMIELDRPGARVVDGLGFGPDFVLFLPGAGGDAEAFEPGLAIGLGVAAAGGEQVATGFSARVHDQDTRARGALRRDAVVALPKPDDSGDYGLLAHAASLDPDGFTLSTSGDGRQTLPVACLALSGGAYGVGLATAGRRRGARTKQKLGFEPAGLLLFSSGLDAMARIRDIGRLCVGGVSAGRPAGCVTWSVRSRKAWPLEPRARSSTESILDVVDTTTGYLHARAVFAAIAPDGFSLEWPVTDRNRRNFAYVAFGSEPRRRVAWRRVTGLLPTWLRASSRAPRESAPPRAEQPPGS